MKGKIVVNKVEITVQKWKNILIVLKYINAFVDKRGNIVPTYLSVTVMSVHSWAYVGSGQSTSPSSRWTGG